MLTLDDLKKQVHRDLVNSDKILLILASLNKPSRIADIKAQAKAAGLRTVDKWNVSQILGRTRGLAINTSVGWELSEAGTEHLRDLGVTKISPAAVQVVRDLHALLDKVSDRDTRAFVQEAIECFERGYYRSAVVMSWLAAVHVLKGEVYNNHLAALNADARRSDPKWKDAKTTDDIGLMKESAFLDRLSAISVVGKNVKDELQKCLKLRNGCGHPNSLKIGPNMVANHLEILLLNVFNRFC